MNLELETILPWGDPRTIQTSRGERILRKASPDQAFWELWREHKEEIKAAGISVGKFNGEFEVAWWQETGAPVAAPVAPQPVEVIETEILQHQPLSNGLIAKLLPHQPQPAAQLRTALTNGNAFDASDTGVGKTFTALAVAADLGMTPCVVCPLAVIPSWFRAAKHFGIKLGFVVNYEKLRTGNTPMGEWVGVKKHEEFRFKNLPANALLIFDEVQKCKSDKSQNGEMLRHAVACGHKILALSATAAKDPTEMRNLGAALRLHDGSWSGWQRWCKSNGCFETQYGLMFNGKKKHLEDIHRQIFPQRGVRVRVADVPGFPETFVTAETLDTGAAKRIGAAYDTAEERINLIASDSTMSGSEKAAEGLAAIMKARQEAELGKLELFKELTLDAVEEGLSVAVFLNFRESIKLFQDAVKTKCVIWGGQSAEERQQAVDDFAADKARIVVVSLQAGGAGIGLHDLNGNHPRLGLYSPSWSAIDLRQSLGRLPRAGAKTKSRQRIIYAAKVEVEERICASVATKLSQIDALNDGDLDNFAK